MLTSGIQFQQFFYSLRNIKNKPSKTLNTFPNKIQAFLTDVRYSTYEGCVDKSVTFIRDRTQIEYFILTLMFAILCKYTQIFTSRSVNRKNLTPFKSR